MLNGCSVKTTRLGEVGSALDSASYSFKLKPDHPLHKTYKHESRLLDQNYFSIHATVKIFHVFNFYCYIPPNKNL